MKKFDSKRLLKNAGVFLAEQILMIIPVLVYWFGPFTDGFGYVFTAVISALVVPFVFGLTNMNMKSKLLISFIATTILDVVFVLLVNSDVETLVVYFGVLNIVAVAGVSLGSLINLIVKTIIKKVKKTDSISENEEG